MFIRAYLRASTEEQDATRAKQQLDEFASSKGHKIASYYYENESGASLDRPELMRLIEEAHPNDILLAEQVDRICRLSNSDWETLKQRIKEKELLIVSLDLPTSHTVFEKDYSDPTTASIMKAVNNMMLDILAAVARKDYLDRRRRQAQGIAKARDAGKYRGRRDDTKKQERIAKLLAIKTPYKEIMETVGCSRGLVAKVSKQMKDAEALAQGSR
ncbi:recombinase family protein [Neptuniibacter sp.]|uniref:recombinase family protein n=1 Tax=Neptuniibacter sp. TaxID=1962643 RepID=UPI0026055539|nr:recombinase family protein [Neptuniibacter sp.]MCP4596859.1 recombinase family protein [Neptuniibacter sp.]